MKKEKLNVIDFLQKNTGWIVTLIGSGLAVFSSIFVLITTFENKLKSIYYHVDFLFYKNSFNFYQLILYFLFILICWQVVFSLKKVILFVYDKLINKKNIIFPKLDLLFAIPFFLLILVLLFIDWLLSFYLLFYFIFYYLIVHFFLKFLNIDIKSNIKEINIVEACVNFVKILLFFSIVEMFFCFVKVTCNFYNKSDYYIIRQDDQLEVVVETYSDYFITKKAQIDGNKLIIMKNSQSMKSTFDTIVTKETFEDIILK